MDGSPRLGEDGVQMTERVARFPLHWMRRHFDQPTDYYLTKDEALSDPEFAGLEKLKKYVGSFKPTHNMADFANELVKILADQKASKKGKKKLIGRTMVKQPPPKRQREEEPIIDVEQFEKPFLLHRVFSDKGFLEKHPPMVAAVERSLVLDMGPAARQDQLVQDTSAVMRLLETALVLNDEQGSSTRELGKLREKNES
ncbi:hypothetical protein A2U01_0002746 [Trifolium medium]|uniref:Uncharacterized protein n=1 Tax=Trifolium medium TaxID=97028 RepID=A0A392M3K4_9FABA|nr:hypothetical protein [Trifolium medium]